MEHEEKRCPWCEAPAPFQAQVCAACGQQLGTESYPSDPSAAVLPPPPYVPPPISPPVFVPPPMMYGALPRRQHSIVAPILLTVLVNWWAGALGNRQWAKGGTLLAITFLALVVDQRVGLGIALLMWAVGLVDTIMVGNRMARGEDVGPWRFF